jgi:DNA uptake protein ComE-like DNA-binding protein
MMRTPLAVLARRAAGATTILLVAACSSGANDAARTDTSAAGAVAASAGPSVPAPNSAIVDSGNAAPGATGAAAASGATASGAMIDPNAATKEQLTAIPGMTAAAADALIAGRPYGDMVAVDKALAKSLTAADTRKQVYAKLWKPIDLNSAKGEEILLIPGVGPRMRHEFEEYRPYKNIEQFRREIGKYVDKAEVARLEQYVTIK